MAEGVALRATPILPDDFPAHLLLRVCDAILSPLLNSSSPLKPYGKPWSRSAPSQWQNATDPFMHSTMKPNRGLSNWTTSSVKSSIGRCKSDLLAFASVTKRVWQICELRIYYHVRVSHLAAADFLVSRRNLLKHTRVLEMYITKETESSQAQTDLNLNRFLIQAGLLLLWCPSLDTILLDIKSAPTDPYIWTSFVSRLRQRLFIDQGPGMRNTPPTFPITAKTNVIKTAGNERSTSMDKTARWGDSQGIVNSRERISIPNLAVGMGYAAAGGVNRGFGGLLEILFSPDFPSRSSILKVQSPLSSNNLGTLKSPPAGRLDGLTSLDLLIPRPSWGQEMSEGFSMGVALRHLGGLKSLSLHADGVTQIHSTNHAWFGLKRTPPFGGMNVGVEQGGEDDVYSAMGSTGAVILTDTGDSENESEASKSHPSSFSGDGSGEAGGYGPETWWAGVLDGLTCTNEDRRDAENIAALDVQSIEDFRISVSVPGGTVQLSDFDAFFFLVLPYFHKMNKLRLLVFDMVFPLPQDQLYQMPASDDSLGMDALLDRQKYYVENLVHPNNSPTLFVPTNSYPTVHGSGSSSPSANAPSSSTEAMAGSRLTSRSDISTSFSESIKHVFFGEYHGIPNLPPYMQSVSVLQDSPSLTPDNTFRPVAKRADSAKSSQESISKPNSIGGSQGSDRDWSRRGMNMDNRKVASGVWWTVKGSDQEVKVVSDDLSDGSDVTVVRGWEE